MSDGANKFCNWLGAKCFTELIKLEQQNDETLSHIIKSLEDGVGHNLEEIQGTSQDQLKIYG